MNESTLSEFQGLRKIARLSREAVITEKIDGTNGQITIDEYGQMFVGSRTQWITPEDDNHGFARWAQEHREELLTLGPGRHFGEWWGKGINRGYWLLEKRFSLFNTIRWCLHGHVPGILPQPDPRVKKFQDMLPPCCGLVPVLYRGVFETGMCDLHLELLRVNGSYAAPGFINPEGIVVWHLAANIGFKKTFKDGPKSA